MYQYLSYCPFFSDPIRVPKLPYKTCCVINHFTMNPKLRKIQLSEYFEVFNIKWSKRIGLKNLIHACHKADSFV